MPSISPPPAHRLDHLDAVRGLAAMAVVCLHYNSAYGVPHTPWVLMATPLRAWWDGRAAVSLFFVLSGLVLSVRHFRDTPRPTLAGFDYVGFLVARACRIGLPYWAVLVASAVAWRASAVYVPGGPPITTWSADLWRTAPTLAGVARQANLFVPSTKFELVPQAWTLALEVVLSALVPAAVLIAARGTGWLLGATVAACCLAGLAPYAVHFALGIALAKHYRAIVARLEPRPAWRGAVWLVGWVAYTWTHCFAARRGWHAGNTDGYASGVGAALLLMACSASPGLRRWLARGVTHHVGRSSYSLYLSHFLVLLCLTPRVMAFLIRHHWNAWVLTWAAGLAFTVVAALAVAEAVYWTVEVPSMAIGRRAAAAVTGRVAGRTATVAAPRGPLPLGQPG